jgi:malonyl-CoA/methylmalonyl-CoA synthetase
VGCVTDSRLSRDTRPHGRSNPVLYDPHACHHVTPMMFEPLLGEDAEALRFPDGALRYPELRAAALALASDVDGAARVAVWADPRLETCVGVLACLVAGVPVVPLNPRIGERELQHVVNDSDPALVLTAPGSELPREVRGRRQLVIDLGQRSGAEPPAEPDEKAPALVIYTSGTTGAPKGAVIDRRAISSNLDALESAWEWSASDRVVHGLPLFHVHGLVLGVLGPLRRGGSVEHVGRFSPRAVSQALGRGGTMLFGVPTMYHRLAEEAESRPAIAAALRKARLLVSGSAALPAAVHARIERLCGQRVVERYGLTETLMNTAVRAEGDRRAGYVGPPLDGVELRLVDDAGCVLEVSDDQTIGEVEVRGPNVFSGYLNRPDATAMAMRDGWFRTGDLATRAADDYIRIVGRRATDLIKSGGFKVGAVEVEGALLEHPAVAEAAVTGEADPDLGERIVAWVVVRKGRRVDDVELSEHVARLLAPHKRPREVRFLRALPRNEMGKVRKRALIEGQRS